MWTRQMHGRGSFVMLTNHVYTLLNWSYVARNLNGVDIGWDILLVRKGLLQSPG